MRHLTIAVLALLSVRAQADAPENETAPARDYSQISLEDLLNKDISLAATKTRVDVAKAPVSVSTLTPEEIRRSGATNLGELLRTIPGVDVLEAFPGYISVSARGTSEAFVNNMLVLIDGRRLETQLAGVPFLEEAPVRLEDVKRIEVVRGPVGALYGTNALAGVISITTYSPEDVRGTLVSLTAGGRDTYQASLRQAGRIGASDWSYKLVGGYTYTSTWESLDAGSTTPPVGERKGDLLLLLERSFTGDRRLDLEAGYSRGDLASLTIVTNQTQYYEYPHFRASFSQPDFHALLTFNPQSLELRERVPPIQPLTDRWSDALNLSLDRTLRPSATTTLTVGGNLRQQRSTFTSIATPHSQVVGSVFAQDEQVLWKDHLTAFGALGVSRHPEIPTQFDGNAALVLTPIKDQTVRASFGRAHRDPAFLESFINFRRRFGPADGYQSSNPDLAPETIRAWEAGYRGRFGAGSHGRLEIFADTFSEKLRDLIGPVTTNVAAGSLPQYPTVTVVQQFRNIDNRNGRGFEVGAEWQSSRVHLVGQYSYQNFDDAATGVDIIKDVPRDKLSGGLGTKVGPVEVDVWAHYVSKTVEDDGYVLVNPRLGVHSGRFSAAFEAFNAFNDRHIETANGRNIKGETIGRLLTVSLRYDVGGK